MERESSVELKVMVGRSVATCGKLRKLSRYTHVRGPQFCRPGRGYGSSVYSYHTSHYAKRYRAQERNWACLGCRKKPAHRRVCLLPFRRTVVNLDQGSRRSTRPPVGTRLHTRTQRIRRSTSCRVFFKVEVGMLRLSYKTSRYHLVTLLLS